LQEWCENRSRESLTIEGRDIEVNGFMDPIARRSTPTEEPRTLYEIVLQRQLYGSNLPFTERIPLDSGTTSGIVKPATEKPTTEKPATE
jgi:hypothetical protein